jgi:hypothetical protein
MGTCIKLEAFADINTSDKNWEKFKTFWFEEFKDAENCGGVLKSGLVYCSYHYADINTIFSSIKEDLKNSKITINLYFEEKAPDEVLYLEVEE